MTTDNRLKLTHLIKKLTDESVEQLLETASKLFAASTTAHQPDCPYCQSSSIVKNGHIVNEFESCVKSPLRLCILGRI